MGAEAPQAREGLALGFDRRRKLRLGRHVVFAPHVAELRDHGLEARELGLERRVLPGLVRHREGRLDAALARRERLLDPALRRLAVELLPDHLGHEGHEGVQEPEHLIEGRRQHLTGHGGLSFVLHPRLDQLQIPVAELVLEEVPRGPDRGRGVVGLEVADHGPGRLAQARQDPAVLRRQICLSQGLEL